VALLPRPYTRQARCMIEQSFITFEQLSSQFNYSSSPNVRSPHSSGQMRALAPCGSLPHANGRVTCSSAAPRGQWQQRQRCGMAAAAGAGGAGAAPPLATPEPGWTPTVAGLPLPPVTGARSAVVQRSTKETKVEVRLDIDGTGRCVASTPVGFLNHMLDQVRDLSDPTDMRSCIMPRRTIPPASQACSQDAAAEGQPANGVGGAGEGPQQALPRSRLANIMPPRYQIASHGLFDLYVAAEGDTWIDDHHTVEDIALALGGALSQVRAGVGVGRPLPLASLRSVAPGVLGHGQ
jgi:hypothetical protein